MPCSAAQASISARRASLGLMMMGFSSFRPVIGQVVPPAVGTAVYRSVLRDQFATDTDSKCLMVLRSMGCELCQFIHSDVQHCSSTTAIKPVQ